MQADGSLFGNTASSVIDFDLPASRLIPSIGPLLQNSIPFPPLGYELASFSPQASIGIFQNLTIDPSVKTELLFSAPVVQVLSDGSKRVIGTGTPLSFRAGEVLNLMPTFIAGRDNAITVKPRFLGDAMVTNQTGLRLSGDMEISGLALDTPLGGVGPAIGPLHVPVGSAEIPFWEPDPFRIDLPDFALPTFQIQNIGGDPFLDYLAEDVRYIPVTPPDANGVAKYRFSVDIEGFSPVTREIQGREIVTVKPGCDDVTYGGATLDPFQLCTPERFFVTDDDLIFEVINADSLLLPVALGSVFCISCNDATAFLDSLLDSDSIGTGIDQIYLSDLSLAPVGDHRDPNDPWLTANLPPAVSIVSPLRIGPTVMVGVPEPGSLALFALGLVTLIRLRWTTGSRWLMTGVEG